MWYIKQERNEIYVLGGQEFLASKRQSRFLNPEQKQDQKQSFRPEAELTEKVIWNLEPGGNPRSPMFRANLIGMLVVIRVEGLQSSLMVRDGNKMS